MFTLLPMLTGEGRAHHSDILREATRLIEAGKLAPRVDPRRFTLSTVGEAYRAVETNDSVGPGVPYRRRLWRISAKIRRHDPGVAS